MTRLLPLSIATAVALLAGGVALVMSGRGTPHEAAREHAPAVVASPPAGPSAAAPPVARRPRPGALSLDDAIRELDLIRPARSKVAEDFTLKTADGKFFRLSEHRGRTVFVNFWATWCPPCREEMPAMERLYREHKDHGLVMVAVAVDADPAVVPPYLRENQLTFPVALDPTMDVANKYGVRALPSSFIVDRQGTMTALALGPRRWDNLAGHSLVEALSR